MIPSSISIVSIVSIVFSIAIPVLFGVVLGCRLGLLLYRGALK
jgi:hypothetical protein